MTYCSRCNRNFHTYEALNQHKNNSSKHNICHKCDTDYQSYGRLRDHQIQSYRHNFCTLCDEDFDSKYELNNHKEDEHEYCEPCDLWLETLEEMQDHDIATHNLCVECNRYFTSLNALKNHLNSSRHRPKKVSCLGRNCNLKFVSASALILHLEAGTCSSGATRQSVNGFVAKHDTNHLITNPGRMITDGSASYQATERAWNGYNYECYFCHKEFQTLVALNQHLASPAHERKTYHCPSQLNTGCKAQFKTLSALCQHVENGSCGVMKFKVVQDSINRLVQGVKRIGL